MQYVALNKGRQVGCESVCLGKFILRFHGLSNFFVSFGILMGSFVVLPVVSQASEMGIDPIITGNVSEGAAKVKPQYGASGLPLPRFASLKDVSMRG